MARLSWKALAFIALLCASSFVLASGAHVEVEQIEAPVEELVEEPIDIEAGGLEEDVQVEMTPLERAKAVAQNLTKDKKMMGAAAGAAALLLALGAMMMMGSGKAQEIPPAPPLPPSMATAAPESTTPAAPEETQAPSIAEALNGGTPVSGGPSQ